MLSLYSDSLHVCVFTFLNLSVTLKKEEEEENSGTSCVGSELGRANWADRHSEKEAVKISMHSTQSP